MNRSQFRRAMIRILLAGLVGLSVAMTAMTASAQTGGVMPLTDEDVAKIDPGPQPIRFSHKIHAGQDKIDCQYCHIYARRSQSSGAPPMAICVGCHRFIANGLQEVQKVLQAYEKKEPIQWVKVHDVPDFVRFTHDKHVTAKNEVFPNGVPCQQCHGPIETMDTVKKFDPNFGLMGWCLQCHLTIPGAIERKQAIAASMASTEVKNYKHPSGNYARPLMSDCITCHY